MSILDDRSALVSPVSAGEGAPEATDATVRGAAGPSDPPSSRPFAGVLGGGGQVLAFRFAPSRGMQRVPVPGTFAVARDAVLHWAFYADGAAAEQAPHAALAVTIDVVFEAADGKPEERVSEHPDVRDRYGFPVSAEAQFAAAWSMPEQWNANSVSLAPWTGRAARVEVVLGAQGLDGPPAEGFIEFVIGSREDEFAPPVGETPAGRVDTRRGSHSGDRFSRGNTIPITAAPHGFCFLTPATDPVNTRWPYRWSVHDDDRGRPLAALQFSHQPSPWIGDRGVLQLRPFIDDEHAQPLRITGREIARPHFYRAELDRDGVAEMTATSHGGVFRLTAAQRVVGFVVGAPDGRGRFTLREDGTFDGWTPEGTADWGNPPRAYFAGRVLGAYDRDAAASGILRAHGALEVRIASRSSLWSRPDAPWRRSSMHPAPSTPCATLCATNGTTCSALSRFPTSRRARGHFADSPTRSGARRSPPRCIACTCTRTRRPRIPAPRSILR